MFRKPPVETLEGAFAKGERRVHSILDLRHRRAPDAGEHAQLGAVELPVRKLRAEQEQRGNGRGRANRFAVGHFEV